MKLFKNIFSVGLAAFCALFLLASCNFPAETVVLEVNPALIEDIPYEGASGVLNIASNSAAIYVESHVSWISVNVNPNLPKVINWNIERQPKNEDREGTVTVYGRHPANADPIPFVVTFRQKGAPDPRITIDPAAPQAIPYTGGAFFINVDTNQETFGHKFLVETDAEWVKVEGPVTGTTEIGFRFKVLKNPANTARIAKIQIYPIGTNVPVEFANIPAALIKTVTINQDAAGVPTATITPENLVFNYIGKETKTVTVVTTPPDCAWKHRDADVPEWVEIIEKIDEATHKKVLMVNAKPYSDTDVDRTCTITIDIDEDADGINIGQKTFTIKQTKAEKLADIATAIIAIPNPAVEKPWDYVSAGSSDKASTITLNRAAYPHVLFEVSKDNAADDLFSYTIEGDVLSFYGEKANESMTAKEHKVKITLYYEWENPATGYTQSYLAFTHQASPQSVFTAPANNTEVEFEADQYELQSEDIDVTLENSTDANNWTITYETPADNVWCSAEKVNGKLRIKMLQNNIVGDSARSTNIILNGGDSWRPADPITVKVTQKARP